MIGDANDVDQGALLRADACIVGGGPAGIALALALSGQGLDIVLLESGQRQPDAPTQSLYDGEVNDEKLHSPPDKYRQRRLGGSSTIWGGRCTPFDAIDFEARSQVPHSGWPISLEDLRPFYPEANRLAEAGRFAYDARQAFSPEAPPMFRGFASEVVSTDGLERFSCPTDFGARYARRLQVARDVHVLLNANCTGLRLDKETRAIREVEVRTLAGRRFAVAARTVVLATGGLETARLLLASRESAPAGIGNEHDVVGRYYMCHIAGNVGTLEIQGDAAGVRHGYEVSPEGIYCRRRIAVREAEQHRRGLANAVARLHFPRITDPRHGSGVLSGLFLARPFISYEYGKRVNDGTAATLPLYARHLLNVAADPLDTLAFLGHWLTRRTLAARKFPSVILRNRSNRFSLELHGEQMPQARSRVTLAGKLDALGMPQLRVNWCYSSADIESLRRTLDVIAQEVERSGLGRLRYDAGALEEDLVRFGAYGGHHIGTTRMGADPRTSVVDANCRVHSVNNLYVAGSAVFPTSSQANPTLTLLALSLRLARHLAQRLSPRPIATLEEQPA
ncbi:GMC family oxidoreductase [Ramlibacter solisilvae]|uniref:FAD-dependent oxidoreductase n=1 Tax=Ramlibacter tataouinensis TaxID=94132 RepID=A0A127JWB1_9BURK|nr:GMC family oxidoreductase [Ramlibacter tataouinensis]AMO24163.1 FAD-dependent oxidoreductase [Ramlibacter tataouinensis]